MRYQNLQYVVGKSTAADNISNMLHIDSWYWLDKINFCIYYTCKVQQSKIAICFFIKYYNNMKYYIIDYMSLVY